MVRIFLLVIAVALCCTSPSMAQSGKPKKEKSWRELIIGAWTADSFVEIRNGERHLEKERKSEQKLIICFTPNNKIASLERNKAAVFGYDLLEGANGRYLRLDESRGVDLQIEELTSKILVLKSIRNPGSKRERGNYIYLSAASFPIDSFRSKLTGTYKLAENDHETKDTVKTADKLIKRPYLISLGAKGQMGSYLGTAKDTGTWTLNPEEFNIVLKGKRSTQELEIKYWRGRGEINVHPKGIPEDSTIMLELIPEDEPETSVSIKKDSVAVSSPETSSYVLTQLCKSWKAVSINGVTTKGKVKQGDSLKVSARFNLLEDGTFNLYFGKKRHSGKWHHLENENAIVLTINGQEQLAIYDFKYNYTPDGVYSDVPDTQLVLTFIPPKSKTALTYVFEKQK